MLVENPLTARHHGKQPFLQAISRPCLAHSGLCKPCRCWCEGVVCKRLFGFFLGKTLFSRLRVFERFRSTPHFYRVHIFSQKNAVKEFSFAQLVRHESSKKLSDSLLFGAAAYWMWKGRLLFLRRDSQFGEEKFFYVVKKENQDFFLLERKEKLENLFFLLVIQYTFYAHTNTGVSRCVRQISTGRVKWIKQIIMTQGHVTALDV